MNTLTVNLPRDVSPERARLILALELFRAGEVSLGFAAEMAGHSLREFMNVLGDHGISVADYPQDELDDELTAFSRLDRGDEVDEG
jgi:predicted HTH domain antitoxin